MTAAAFSPPVTEPSVVRMAGGGRASKIASGTVDELQFEWDAEKAGENLAKHDVSFEEAATVFYEDLGKIDDDPNHSIGEHRELLLAAPQPGGCLSSALPSEAMRFASLTPGE